MNTIAPSDHATSPLDTPPITVSLTTLHPSACSALAKSNTFNVEFAVVGVAALVVVGRLANVVDVDVEVEGSVDVDGCVVLGAEVDVDTSDVEVDVDVEPKVEAEVDVEAKVEAEFSVVLGAEDDDDGDSATPVDSAIAAEEFDSVDEQPIKRPTLNAMPTEILMGADRITQSSHGSNRYGHPFSVGRKCL